MTHIKNATDVIHRQHSQNKKHKQLKGFIFTIFDFTPFQHDTFKKNAADVIHRQHSQDKKH